MFCKNCGNRLEEDAIFCSKCGSKERDDVAVSGKEERPAPAEKEDEIEALRKRLSELMGSDISSYENLEDGAGENPKDLYFGEIPTEHPEDLYINVIPTSGSGPEPVEEPIEWGDDKGDDIEDRYLYPETGRPTRLNAAQ